MPSRSTAEKLMDEILVFTVLKKEWNFKRIAQFTVDKQIEMLEEILKTVDHPLMHQKLDQLRAISEDITNTKL